MQKKLLFFVNPRAGHSEIRGSLMQAIQIFTAGGYEDILRIIDKS